MCLWSCFTTFLSILLLQHILNHILYFPCLRSAFKVLIVSWQVYIDHFEMRYSTCFLVMSCMRGLFTICTIYPYLHLPRVYKIIYVMCMGLTQFFYSRCYIVSYSPSVLESFFRSILFKSSCKCCHFPSIC